MNRVAPNKLSVTTHIKSTNKQAYTHASSYHPPGTGKGIAVGEAKRYARINTLKVDFTKSNEQHIRQMNTRGYHFNHIVSAIRSVSHENRFQSHTPHKQDRSVFVTR